MHLPRVLAVALLAALLVAGCHAPADERETVRLMGWFSDYNETIAADFDATVSPYSDNVLLMESFPPGFQILDLEPDGCAELRDKLLEKPYLASVGECEAEPVTSSDGDNMTSSNGA